MNDDVEVITPCWLERLVARLQLEMSGAVGPMLYYPDNTIQHAGVTLGIWGVAGHSFINQQRGSGGYVGRAASSKIFMRYRRLHAVRREASSRRGLHEAWPSLSNDVDLCIRLRNAGGEFSGHRRLSIIITSPLPSGNTTHRTQTGFAREVALMRNLFFWGSTLDADPFLQSLISSLSSEPYDSRVSAPSR